MKVVFNPQSKLASLIGKTFECEHCGAKLEIEEGDLPREIYSKTVIPFMAAKCFGVDMDCPCCNKKTFVII